MISQAIRELVAEARQAVTQSEVRDVLTSLDTALRLTSEQDDRAILLTAKAIAGIGIHTPDETAAVLEEAIPLLRDGEQWDAVLTATTSAATNALQRGKIADAAGLAVEALQLMRREGIDPEVIPAAASNLSNVLNEFGAYELAYDLALESFTATVDGARPETLPVAAFNLARAALDGQRWVELEPPRRTEWTDAAARAALTIVEQGSNEFHRAVLGHGVMAEVCIERGDVAAARRHVNVAIAAIDLAVADPETTVIALGSLVSLVTLTEGVILRREGQLTDAMERFDRALPGLVGMFLPTVRCLTARSEVAAELDQWERSYRDANQLAEMIAHRHVGHSAGLVAHLLASAEQEDEEEVPVELVEAPHPLAEQLRVDALTGVASRGWFDVVLGERSQALGVAPVLVLDVDGMMAMNDEFGLVIGDAVLQAIGAILTAHSRVGDLVARYSGDQFIILPERSALEEANELAGRFCRSIAENDWSIMHPDLKVTVSIGVSSGLARDVTKTVRQAEAYLHEAKASGNRVAGPGNGPAPEELDTAAPAIEAQAS